jgi:acyl-CoA thioesterase-1
LDFLGPIPLQPELMLDDGIHPNAAAQGQILERVWPHLQPLL